MAGENSKKTGDIGEKIAAVFLSKIGWGKQIHNISIVCHNEDHQNSSGAKKQSHGEDIVYIYDTPFRDKTTICAHISVKNTEIYPKNDANITKQFKSHIKDLEQLVECAKHDANIIGLVNSFEAKKNIQHVGILIWLQKDRETIDRNILEIISKSRLDLNGDTPYYVIDSSRANFVLKAINNLILKSNGGSYKFYYPKIGTSILVELDRIGTYLPIELLVSDIITAVVTIDKHKIFYLYIRDAFEELTYKNMTAYALDFSSGLIDEIYIGFPDYNPTKDLETAQKVNISFKDRSENVSPFCYNESILNLYEE